MVPLREQWVVPDRVHAIDDARLLHDKDPDLYWEWASHQLRWTTPWTTLRSGGFEDARWFEGGTLNVADNCLDRWAECPSTADRRAVVWEGEPGDTRTVTYADLRDETSS